MKNGLSAGRAEHIGYQRLPSVISGLSKSHGKANPTRGISHTKVPSSGRWRRAGRACPSGSPDPGTRNGSGDEVDI